VPADNPFVGVAGARPEIWVWGLRNAWRFSFDPADGSLWIGDVGQGRWEEISHLPRGEQAGANLGWSCREGLEVFDAAQCDPDADLTAPVFTYSPYTHGCAVIGGQVYRGRQYADLLTGTYIASDYCSSTVWALRPDGRGGWEHAEIGEFPTQVTAIGTTVEGEFYLVNDLPGMLHRVSFGTAAPACEIAVATRTWGTGMTLDLTVTNTGTTPVDAWSLRFPLALGQRVVSDWNTNAEQFGDIVTATPPATHNTVIPPGGSVTLGFLVEHTNREVPVGPPGRYELNGRTCGHTP
jgi:hypothetical protein